MSRRCVLVRCKGYKWEREEVVSQLRFTLHREGERGCGHCSRGVDSRCRLVSDETRMMMSLARLETRLAS